MNNALGKYGPYLKGLLDIVKETFPLKEKPSNFVAVSGSERY